jgi:hypothetical protein
MSTSFARISGFMFATLFALGGLVSSAQAADGTPFDIGSKHSLTAPADWVKKEPRSRIVEYEFEIPKAEGDELPGRVTVMGAGGGVEANVARWKGQFKSEEGDVKADIKQSKVAEQDIHFVDIKGTYVDKPSPFAQTPGVDRANYRMIGAIITTEGGGQYFVKAYGPAKTMEKALPGFQKMLDGLKAK